MDRRSWTMLLATAALWGSSYMFIKVALEDVSEGAIVCIRTALGAALLLSLAAHRRVLGALRGRLRWVTIVAFVQVVAPFLLITYGENHVSSSLTAILISTVPLFTVLLALRFDHSERAHGWALAGVAIGLIGVVLLFGVDLSGDADELAGGGMMLLAALGYAISWLLVKHKLTGAAPEALAGGTMLIAALATLPLLVAAPPDASVGLEAAGSLVALGIGGTGLAFVLYYTLIAEVGARRASMLGYVIPAFSVVYGVVLLGETLTAAALGGLALILLGSWLGAEGRLPGRRRGEVSRSGPSRSSARAPARVR